MQGCLLSSMHGLCRNCGWVMFQGTLMPPRFLYGPYVSDLCESLPFNFLELVCLLLSWFTMKSLGPRLLLVHSHPKPCHIDPLDEYLNLTVTHPWRALLASKGLMASEYKSLDAHFRGS